MKKFALVFLLLALLASCGSGSEMHEIQIGDVLLRVEIANTPENRQRGLMFRDWLGEFEGMLFVFPNEAVLGFWMKNTKIPLSIAFIDANNQIRTIRDMQPFDESSVSSVVPVKYALEVNQGFFARNGIRAGQFLKAAPELLTAQF